MDKYRKQTGWDTEKDEPLWEEREGVMYLGPPDAERAARELEPTMDGYGLLVEDGNLMVRSPRPPGATGPELKLRVPDGAFVYLLPWELPSGATGTVVGIDPPDAWEPVVTAAKEGPEGTPVDSNGDPEPAR